MRHRRLSGSNSLQRCGHCLHPTAEQADPRACPLTPAPAPRSILYPQRSGEGAHGSTAKSSSLSFRISTSARSSAPMIAALTVANTATRAKK